MSLVVGLLLVFGGLVFAIIQLAPCAFADSRPPTEGILATAERWLEVEAPVPDVDGIHPDGSGHAKVQLHVRLLDPDGDPSSSVVAEGVAIHDVYLRQIRPALEEGSRVFLALASEGRTRESVSYVVARRRDGTHVFLSSCHIDLTAESRDLLGSRYEPVMRRLIGLVGHDVIYRLLAGVRPARGHVLVEWTRNGPRLRMFSRSGTLIERGPCLAVETEVGPLVPIFDSAQYYLAADRDGLVVMAGLDRVARPGDRLDFAGRELAPAEAVAYASRDSIRRCPGRLILVSGLR